MSAMDRDDVLASCAAGASAAVTASRPRSRRRKITLMPQCPFGSNSSLVNLLTRWFDRDAMRSLLIHSRVVPLRRFGSQRRHGVASDPLLQQRERGAAQARQAG